MSVKQTRKKYTSEFKFKLALEAEKTDELTITARKYGINESLSLMGYPKILKILKR